MNTGKHWRNSFRWFHLMIVWTESVIYVFLIDTTEQKTKRYLYLKILKFKNILKFVNQVFFCSVTILSYSILYIGIRPVPLFVPKSWYAIRFQVGKIFVPEYWYENNFCWNNFVSKYWYDIIFLANNNLVSHIELITKNRHENFSYWNGT